MTEAVEVRGAGRDPEVLQAQLAAWFESTLPDFAPVISALHRPESNGMSSESVLFDVELTEGGERRSVPCVARLAPEADSVPVFPTYDLEAQFNVIRLVEARTDVPVPSPRWLEPGAEALGSPFFVMDRLVGRVPPDVMPYNFDSWLKEAEEADQRRLVDGTMQAIAGIHTLTPENADLAFLEIDEPGDTALRRHLAMTNGYYRWAHDGQSIPVLDRGFAWLDANFPRDEGPAVLLWGDARIGNVLYDGFDPIGVLDWEMASVGPPELDVSWGIFLHRFFEDLAADMEVVGMPDFLRLDDVVASYERASGYAPRDMHWFLAYAAVRHGVVMSRIHLRQVQLGVAEMPADRDEMVLHRATIHAMVDGSYWETLP